MAMRESVVECIPVFSNSVIRTTSKGCAWLAVELFIRLVFINVITIKKVLSR